MLLSLLRLSRSPNRRLAVLLLAVTYTWAFAALDVTHTHAAPRVPTGRHMASVPNAAPTGGHALTHATAGAPEAPCPVCAAVHAAAAALVQPPAPIHTPAPARLRVAQHPAFTPSNSPTTLHLRGPPQA